MAQSVWTRQHGRDMGHYMCACRKCGRKILIEMVFFGVQHNGEPIVTCANCIAISKSFAEQFPEQAKIFEAWRTLPQLRPNRRTRGRDTND